jgi:hypothetical protein
MEKRHSRNIHIGNQGEHIVAEMLSKKCIVRDVGQGKDTGIDLYCEILNDETLELSLHFFCQVKTVKGKFKQNTIRKEFYDYWGNQPVPVFLMVVEYENEKNIQGTHELWVHDIPYILAKRDARALGKNEPLRDVHEEFKLCSESNNKDKMKLEDFLYHHIPWSHGLWQLRRFGLVLHNPEIKNRENKILVGGFTYLYEEKIVKEIQNIDYLLKNDKYNR